MKTKDYKPGLLKRLQDPEYAAGYLADVLEHETQEAFLIAVRNVIEARSENMSALADDAGLTRQTLYHALSESGNPRLSTLREVLKSLGLRISIAEDKAA